MTARESESTDKLKILLLQAPITLKAEDVATFGFFPPLGLAYLAAVLRQADFSVAIHDLLIEGAEHKVKLESGLVRIGLGENEIEARLIAECPQIVGIGNNFTSFSEDSLNLASLVKRILPEAILVMGGAHASVEYRSLLETGLLDGVVVGEGEETFPEIVRAYEKGGVMLCSR